MTPRNDKEFLDRFKEFKPTSFAVDHAISVKVLLVIITIMGVMSYVQTPKESFPEIELPMIGVSTIYPGVSPSDIESLVTRPLEDELSTISDIKELTSSSTEGSRRGESRSRSTSRPTSRIGGCRTRSGSGSGRPESCGNSPRVRRPR